MTDILQQYLRPYIEPRGFDATKRGRRTESPTSIEGQAIRALGRPYEGRCLVVGLETAKVPRFGQYSLYGISVEERIRLYRAGMLTRAALDGLNRSGLFYDPSVCTEPEFETLEALALERGWSCMPVETFVNKIFYPWVYRWKALCIGHNLPFILSRLAVDWGDATGMYRGGFWFKLCRCAETHCFNHPAVRVKHLGKPKAMIGFAGRTFNAGRTKHTFEGRFLDTAMFGRALLGPGEYSPEGLSRRFGLPLSATARPDCAVGTKDTVLACTGGVAATWRLYQAERELYRRHGINTPMWKIFSEASICKGYYEALGFPPFMKQNPHLPKQVLGRAMMAFYGGRVEVNRRLEPTEIMYCDFLSQYPTVHALMKLQELLLAERIDVRDCTEEIRQWLPTMTLNEWQRPETWPLLRVLVKLRPHGDRLPFRAKYNGELAACNIGTPIIESGPEVWYAFADVVASVLDRGTVPEIIKAIELVPVGRIRTKPMALFGDPERVIDLATQDFFTGIMNYRDVVKAELQTATGERRAFLDGFQRALKLIGNSGCFGLLMEVNAKARTSQPHKMTIARHDVQETDSHVVEQPGAYFAGPVGTLVPAAGRLLLMIAEQLAKQRGIDCAFMDTDSIGFSRPYDMKCEDFCAKVSEIIAWFEPLCPYAKQRSILETEKENLYQEEPEPLFFIGISSKRYVLYNRCSDGTYRIRKFSSHGTGAGPSHSVYVSPADIPEPELEPGETVESLGGPRWLYDLWYQLIVQVEAGNSAFSVAMCLQLQLPAFHQVTITTPQLLKDFRHIDGIRPFSDLTVLPSLSPLRRTLHELTHRKHRHPTRAVGVVDGKLCFDEGDDKSEQLSRCDSFYAPASNSIDAIRGEIRRSDTHEVIDVEHTTWAEMMDGYFQHAEAKMADPTGIGTIPIRHVRAANQVFLGKETSEVLEELQDESGGVIPYGDAALYGQTDLIEILRDYTDAEVVKVTGLAKQTVRDLRAGSIPRSETLARLLDGLWRLEAGHDAG